MGHLTIGFAVDTFLLVVNDGHASILHNYGDTRMCVTLRRETCCVSVLIFLLFYAVHMALFAVCCLLWIVGHLWTVEVSSMTCFVTRTLRPVSLKSVRECHAVDIEIFLRFCLCGLDCVRKAPMAAFLLEVSRSRELAVSECTKAGCVTPTVVSLQRSDWFTLSKLKILRNAATTQDDIQINSI